MALRTATDRYMKSIQEKPSRDKMKFVTFPQGRESRSGNFHVESAGNPISPHLEQI
jgi:hypothetical protein